MRDPFGVTQARFWCIQTFQIHPDTSLEINAVNIAFGCQGCAGVVCRQAVKVFQCPMLKRVKPRLWHGLDRIDERRLGHDGEILRFKAQSQRFQHYYVKLGFRNETLKTVNLTTQRLFFGIKVMLDFRTVDFTLRD